MSNPDPLTPWAGRRAPGLPLGIGHYLHREGFCADCIRDGKQCPDHRQDPEMETAS